MTVEEGKDVVFTVTANEGYTLSADNAELVSVEGLVYTFKVTAISSDVTVTITATEIPVEPTETIEILANSPWTKEGAEGDVIYTDGGYTKTTVYTGSNSMWLSRRYYSKN